MYLDSQFTSSSCLGLHKSTGRYQAPYLDRTYRGSVSCVGHNIAMKWTVKCLIYTLDHTCP